MTAAPSSEDATQLAQIWPLVLLRGVAAILFGVVALVAPRLSLGLLVFLFGAYALVDGALTAVSAIRARGEERWTMLLLEGIAGILFGCLAIARPAVTTVALIYLVAFWALVTGVMAIGAAIRLRRQIDNEWTMALSGTATLAIGALLLMFPGPSALVLTFWIGAYAIIFGGLLFALAMRLAYRGHGPDDAASTLWHRTRTA